MSKAKESSHRNNNGEYDRGREQNKFGFNAHDEASNTFRFVFGSMHKPRVKLVKLYSSFHLRYKCHLRSRFAWKNFTSIESDIHEFLPNQIGCALKWQEIYRAAGTISLMLLTPAKTKAFLE
jgi:hypothetical protein